MFTKIDTRLAVIMKSITYLLAAGVLVALFAFGGSLFYPYESQAERTIGRYDTDTQAALQRVLEIQRTNFEYGSLNLGYKINSIQIKDTIPEQYSNEEIYPCPSTREKKQFLIVTFDYYTIFFLPRSPRTTICTY